MICGSRQNEGGGFKGASSFEVLRTNHHGPFAPGATSEKRVCEG